MISHTKQCNWCNRRKRTDSMMFLYYIMEGNRRKGIYICLQCNFKHEIV